MPCSPGEGIVPGCLAHNFSTTLGLNVKPSNARVFVLSCTKLFPTSAFASFVPPVWNSFPSIQLLILQGFAESILSAWKLPQVLI
jgi:hypothetical protein